MLFDLLKMICRDIQHQYFIIHGSAVSNSQFSLILLGDSGTGKTSLMLGLLNRGCYYMADDMILVDPNTLKSMPFPLGISIKPYHSHSLFQKPYKSLLSKNVWYVEPRGVYPGYANKPSSIKYIVFPKYYSQSQTVLSSLKRLGAVKTLLRHGKNSPLIGASVVDLALQLTDSAECYHLSFSHIRSACDKIHTLLN